MFHANGNDRKAGVAILISGKIDFKTKAKKKDKGGHKRTYLQKRKTHSHREQTCGN